MEPLEAYRNAVNSHNPDSLMPFMADSFEFMDYPYPVSVSFLRNLIVIFPFVIDSFSNISTTPEEGALLIEADAFVHISEITDVVRMSFRLQESDGRWRILSVVEPFGELQGGGELLAAISTPMELEGGKLFVSVEVGDGEKVWMVLHNSLSKTVLSPDFASKCGAEKGMLKSLSLCGVEFNDLAVNIGDIDAEKVKGEDVAGAIGQDILGGYTILVDLKNRRLSLIDKERHSELDELLRRFGISEEPALSVKLLGDYPFDVVSVDIGFGFEVPMAFDLSTPNVILFSDFFKDVPPSLKMDEDLRNFIAKHPGRMFTHRYISLGGMRWDKTNSLISGEGTLCGEELPSGIAGIIGAAFFRCEKILVDNIDGNLSIY